MWWRQTKNTHTGRRRCEKLSTSFIDRQRAIQSIWWSPLREEKRARLISDAIFLLLHDPLSQRVAVIISLSTYGSSIRTERFVQHSTIPSRNWQMRFWTRSGNWSKLKPSTISCSDNLRGAFLQRQLFNAENLGDDKFKATQLVNFPVQKKIERESSSDEEEGNGLKELLMSLYG